MFAWEKFNIRDSNMRRHQKALTKKGIGLTVKWHTVKSTPNPAIIQVFIIVRILKKNRAD